MGFLRKFGPAKIFPLHGTTFLACIQLNSASSNLPRVRTTQYRWSDLACVMPMARQLGCSIFRYSVPENVIYTLGEKG